MYIRCYNNIRLSN